MKYIFRLLAYGILDSFDMLFTSNSSIISQFIDWLVMFIFCLCDVGYWISVKIRVHAVQKVKRKYVGSFTAEVRTVYFSHRFEVFSPFRGILRRNSEAGIAHLITFGGPKYTNILQIRIGAALQTNICPEIFFDHLKEYLSAF